MDQPGEKWRFTNVAYFARSKGIIESSGTGQGIGTGKQGVEKRKRADIARKPDTGGCGGFFRRSPEEVGKRLRFEYIRDHATADETTLYCRILGVTPQGYAKYAQRLTKPYKYAALLANIKAILAEDEFNKTYGKRRMFEKLQLDYDCPYCYNTVAKVMREKGLLRKKNRPKGLTQADKAAQKSDNLLKQDFSADAPNQKVVTDITEWTACDGKVYQSAVFDCFDNTCLGLSLADNMRTELCIETFKQAAGRYDLRGAVGHSDRGSQYTSELFRRVLAKLGISQSMNGASGRCHDNAKCESMWARGKEEIMACYDTKQMTCEQLKRLIFRYYMCYWNNRRICSAIGGVPPTIKRGAYYEMLADHVA
jgi:transposase InsO family protein